MAFDWLVYLVIFILLMADLIIVLGMVILGAIMAGYFLFNAFQNFLQGLINQLIRDILAALQGYIGDRSGKAAGYTSFALYVVKKVYALVYGVYNLFQSAVTVAIILVGGMLAALGVLTLVLINAVLVYLLYRYSGIIYSDFSAAGSLVKTSILQILASLS